LLPVSSSGEKLVALQFSTFATQSRVKQTSIGCAEMLAMTPNRSNAEKFGSGRMGSLALHQDAAARGTTLLLLQGKGKSDQSKGLPENSNLRVNEKDKKLWQQTVGGT